MIAELERFTECFNGKKHLSGLLTSRRHLTVDFGGWLLQISEGSAVHLTGKAEGEADTIEVLGQPEALAVLLTGKVRLRTLMERGLLNVRGSFRTVLLLESIFLLTKNEES